MLATDRLQWQENRKLRSHFCIRLVTDMRREIAAQNFVASARSFFHHDGFAVVRPYRWAVTITIVRINIIALHDSQCLIGTQVMTRAIATDRADIFEAQGLFVDFDTPGYPRAAPSRSLSSSRLSGQAPSKLAYIPADS